MVQDLQIRNPESGFPANVRMLVDLQFDHGGLRAKYAVMLKARDPLGRGSCWCFQAQVVHSGVECSPGLRGARHRRRNRKIPDRPSIGYFESVIGLLT